jgi:tetratricopeptide (TPR) repeat protein
MLASPEPAQAVEPLTRWCELDPNNPEPYRLRMHIRHRMALGKWSKSDQLRMMEEAWADGECALALDPAPDEVRREVTWLAILVGRYSTAEAHARRCLASAPNDGWSHYLLAKACHLQGKREEAVRALDPVVKSQPKFADALVLRAMLYREADQPEQAIPLLRQVLTMGTTSRRERLYQLGLALAAAGQSDEAKRVMAEVDLMSLKSAIANDHFPNNPAMRVQIAEAQLAAGNLTDAAKELDAALAEDPDFAPAHRAKATYHEKRGEPHLAAEHRRRIGMK